MSWAEVERQRPPGCDDDVHAVESLVAEAIERYSRPGDVVLDPFAGYGTTLVVAERLGRRAVGVDLLAERAETARRRTAELVVVGDARELDALVAGPVDLCVTSPPYMNDADHPENPLTSYRTLDGDYRTYLRELDGVFAAAARLVRPGGHLVVNVANIRTERGLTPLAWDVGRLVRRHLRLVDEYVVCWDGGPAWLSGDYWLVFRRPD
jgi:DNA modification methylase